MVAAGSPDKPIKLTVAFGARSKSPSPFAYRDTEDPADVAETEHPTHRWTEALLRANAGGPGDP